MVEALGFATLFELRVHVGARIRWIFNPSSSRLPPQSGQPCSKGSEECSALQVLALQQAIPGLEPDSAYDGALPSIDAAPGLHRRHALQVLMRPRLVVPTDELDQRGGERLLIRHDPAVELLLERAEEPFTSTGRPAAGSTSTRSPTTRRTATCRRPPAARTCRARRTCSRRATRACTTPAASWWRWRSAFVLLSTKCCCPPRARRRRA